MERARRAIIALGANLGDRAGNIEAALAALARLGRLRARSRLIETEAVIHPEDEARWHPPFLNAVAILDTAHPPLALLDALQAIERALGRDRSRETKPWQPRVIDLDLVAIEDLVLDHPRLTLPHPRLPERRFVLAPLVEVWPDWIHPRLGLPASALLARLQA